MAALESMDAKSVIIRRGGEVLAEITLAKLPHHLAEDVGRSVRGDLRSIPPVIDLAVLPPNRVEDILRTTRLAEKHLSRG